MKEHADKINADKEFTMEAYNYIRSELDKETAKPLRKRDFDRIEQLTAQLNELTGDNSDSEQPDTSELYKRIRNYEKTSKKPFSVMKRFAEFIFNFEQFKLFITKFIFLLLPFPFKSLNIIVIHPRFHRFSD